MKYLILMIILTILLVISPAYSYIIVKNTSTATESFGYRIEFTQLADETTGGNWSEVIKFKLNALRPTYQTGIYTHDVSPFSRSWSGIFVMVDSSNELVLDLRILGPTGGWLMVYTETGLTVSLDTEYLMIIRYDLSVANEFTVSIDLNGFTYSTTYDTTGMGITAHTTGVTSQLKYQFGEYSLFDQSGIKGPTGTDMNLYFFAIADKIVTDKDIQLMMTRPGGSVYFTKTIQTSTFFEMRDGHDEINEFDSANDSSPSLLPYKDTDFIGYYSSSDLCSVNYKKNTNLFKKTRRK